MSVSLTSKHNLVREVFDDSSRYLKRRQFDINIRRQTVATFTREMEVSDILDIGCGDGALSVPLLRANRTLTLLDISSNMLSSAESRIPSNLHGNVTLRNEDFMEADLEHRAFDLILCVGVVAHVDSVEDLLGKIALLLKPGGYAVVEFTDSFHVVGRMGRIIGYLKSWIAPGRYRVNLLRASRMQLLFGQNGLVLEKAFRYGILPLLEFHRVLPQETMYRIVKWVYGDAVNSRNIDWGNEYICLLRLGKI